MRSFADLREIHSHIGVLPYVSIACSGRQGQVPHLYISGPKPLTVRVQLHLWCAVFDTVPATAGAPAFLNFLDL